MFEGYVQIRRGILEHIRSGWLSHDEALAYLVMIAEANPETGIWVGSARMLAAHCLYSDRKARKLLESLAEKKYLNRFATAGARGNYPVLIDKFEVARGPKKGMTLNAVWSTSWDTPLYEKSRFDEVEGGEQAGDEVASTFDEPIAEKSTSCGEQPKKLGEQGGEQGGEQVASGPIRNARKRNKTIQDKKESCGLAATIAARLVFAGQKLRIRVAEDQALGQAFGWVDRQAEYRRMDAWLVANPARPKKNHAKFALNWLRNCKRPVAVDERPRLY